MIPHPGGGAPSAAGGGAAPPEPVDARLQNIRLAAILLASGVGAAWLTLYDQELSMTAMSWVAMSFLILCPLWLRPDMRREAFHPFSYFVFMAFVAYAGPGLIMILSQPAAAATGAFQRGCVLVGVSLFVWSLGYESRVGPALARWVPLFTFDRGPTITTGVGFWLTVLVLYVVGWIGRIGSAALGFTHLPVDVGAVARYGSLLKDLNMFATLSYMLMVFVLLTRSSRRTLAVPVAVVLMLMEVAAGSLYGGRSQLAVPILHFAMVYHFGVRPIRWRTLMVAYVSAFVLLAPVLTVYRESYYRLLLRGDSAGFATVSQAISDTGAHLVSPYFRWRQTLEGNTFERATGTIDGTSRVMRDVPALYDFELGGTFAPALTVMFIPRVFWPDKPAFLPGREFAKRFFGLDPDKVLGTSVGIGMPAEAYYNFWWMGVLLFLPLGMSYRFFTERFQQYRRRESIYIVRAVFVLLLISDTTGAILYYVGGNVRALPVFMLYLVLVTRQLPRVHRQWV